MAFLAAKNKAHWVSDTKVTHCSHSGCGKQFSTFVRKHHCRKCGYVYCDTHSQRRLRLDAEGNRCTTGTSEPARVCDGCFERLEAPAAEVPKSSSSVALNVAEAPEDLVRRDRTALFLAKRTTFNRENRAAMEAVIHAYTELRMDAASKSASVVGGVKKMSWKGPSDTHATGCELCRRGFTQIFRKHHCRICSRVVCENCSANRKTSAEHGGFVYRSCFECNDKLERHERATEFSQMRQAAMMSPFATAFQTTSAASKAVRELVLLLETQVTQLGTPAANALTAYEDAFAIKDMVERAFGAHVDAYKKCMSLRLETPGEIKTRDGLKRQLDMLRLESVPRYHALKRQLELKQERRQTATQSAEEVESSQIKSRVKRKER